jgi:DNA-binding transcriptional regulator YiaG
MPISEEKRRRLRELKRDMEVEALKLKDFELALRLQTPQVLSAQVVSYLRTKLQATQMELAVDLGVHLASVEKWELGRATPAFGSVVLLIVAELLLLSQTTPFDVEEYDPAQGILGRILSCGAVPREQVMHAFERLGEVLMTPTPKTMEVASEPRAE